MKSKKIKPKKRGSAKMQIPTLPPDSNMMPIADNGYSLYPWQQYQNQYQQDPNWHSPMAVNQGMQDNSQVQGMQDQNQQTNFQPIDGNKQTPKKKGFSFTTPGTGDLLAAGLQFADAMIPEHQSRRIRPYNQLTDSQYSQGTGSQAIFKYGGEMYADGGVADDYTQRSYRKHNIQVTEDIPNQPIYNPPASNTLPEVDVYGNRINRATVATPVNREKQYPVRGFNYVPTYNSYGKPDSYSIDPYGYNSSQIPQLLNSLPETYNGFPVNRSYDQFREERQNFHPQSNTQVLGNIRHDYSQQIPIQDYMPFEYGGQTGGKWMGQVANRTYAPDTHDDRTMANGGSLSPEKAKEILRDGTAQGHPLTPKQKKYFGFIAGGGKAEDGMEIPEAKSGIKIKPSHKGRFTEYKKRTGKTTEEALHSPDPHVRQMANFARNAKKWSHGENGLSVGQELDLTPEEIAHYKSLGYSFE